MTNHLLAQIPKSSSLGNIGEGPGFGPFGNSGTLDPFVALTKIISVIIGFITVCAGIYFMFQFLIGGFEWLQASGDKSRLTKAQDRLTHAVIGLIVVVASYSIVGLMGSLLGFDLLLQNQCQIINALKLGTNPCLH